jgi:hypothetical protein
VRHYHIDKPFLCIKSTMMGWAISKVCDPEMVELCSEMVIGDVSFMPNLNAMFEELIQREVTSTDIQRLQKQIAAPITQY